MAAHASPTPSGTQSIERAIGLLRLIAAHNENGMRLVDIVRVSGRKKSTCFRIVQRLLQQGMVSELQPGSRYVLGPLVYELGLGAHRRFHIGDICHPILEVLAEQTKDAVFFSIRSGDELSCVDEAIGSYPIKAYTRRIGDRRPLGFGCSGIAILSCLDEREVRSILRRNTNELIELGISETKHLMLKIKLARQEGFSLHERPTLGLRAIAVAICDQSNFPIGSLSLCALSARIDGKRLPSLVESLHRSAKLIEDILHRGKPLQAASQ